MSTGNDLGKEIDPNSVKILRPVIPINILILVANCKNF